MSYSEKLKDLEEKGRLRNFTQITQEDGPYVIKDGHKLFNLSSNDYLGIASDITLHDQFYSTIDKGEFSKRPNKFRLGTCSSRLLSGSVDSAHTLEEQLKIAYRSEAALLFNSGYHLNVGVLPALMQKGDLILSDKLNHASIHDGFRLSHATTKRFNHADYQQLRAILEKERRRYTRAVIVTESVFSMDGDVANIIELIQLKNEFDCLLYIDEAHSVGVYGESGLGKCEELNVLKEIDLLIGTFGKGYGSVGAYLICNENIKQYLINSSRSLIFTTALPPINYEWNSFVFNYVCSQKEKRLYLADISDQIRNVITKNNLESYGSTNIIPIVLGDDKKAVECSTALEKSGYLVMPVRPPAVPEGTARLRLSLCANMERKDLDSFIAALLRIV